MRLTTRRIQDSDYNEYLAPWWKEWGWEPLPADFLPRIGVMVMIDGEPFCAGFFYITNSKVCWVEWVVSKRERHELRKDAITLLVSTLTDMAQSIGCKYVYTLLKNQSLINTYKSLGYVKGSENQVEMIKRL
jgi:hypothetical protein